jgi:hypothetical protein
MIFATASVSACSFPVTSLEHQVEAADDIFIATLIEAKVVPTDDRHKWPSIEGRFQVKKILKGEAQPKEVILTTGLGRSDCGVGMMVSWNYVIFKARKDTGIAEVGGTHIIEDFEVEELAKKIQLIVRHRPSNSLQN